MDRAGGMRMPIGAKVAVVLVLLLTGASCETTVPQEEIWGTYVGRLPFGSERITLERDGTFVHKVVVDAPRNVVVRSGRWSYDRETERVSLDGCVNWNDGFGRLRPGWDTETDHLCGPPLERAYLWFGTLRIGSDEGYPLWKQE